MIGMLLNRISSYTYIVGKQLAVSLSYTTCKQGSIYISAEEPRFAGSVIFQGW